MQNSSNELSASISDHAKVNIYALIPDLSIIMSPALRKS